MFNRSIINLPTHIKLIIKVLFFDDFCQYLTEIENKIKQLLVRWINKFERFFEKMYKIKAATAIPRLLKLIYNNLLLSSFNLDPIL